MKFKIRRTGIKPDVIDPAVEGTLAILPVAGVKRAIQTKINRPRKRRGADQAAGFVSVPS